MLALFIVLVTVIPASGFFDLYLLPWQSRLIVTEHPDLWRAMEDNWAAYLPFTRFSALPYGPLFYYPLAFWLLCLDTLTVIDLRAWNNFEVAPSSMKYTALLKFPNLAVHLAIGVVLLKTMPGRAGQDAMLLWLLNPAVILGSFVMGQNDGWSMLGVLLATMLGAAYFRGERELRLGRWRISTPLVAMAILGASGAVKLQPLLFVVPFALTLGQTWRERVLFAGTGLAVFGLLVAPFAWEPFFRDHALFSPQSKNILDHRLLGLPVFYLAYAAAAFLSWGLSRGLQSLLVALISIHLLIFALSDWPPERAMWFIGALALPAALSRAALIAYVLTTAQVFIVAMGLGNDLGLGAFALMSKQFELWPGLDGALDRLWDYDNIVTCGRWLGVTAWSLGLLAILRRQALRPKAVPEWLPVAALLLLPAYFAGALVYGMTGWSSASGTPGEQRIEGPVVVEQRFVAKAFSSLDLAVDGTDARPQLEVDLALGFGAEPAALKEMTAPQDGHVRLRFEPELLRGGGEHRLRLSVPAGVRLGTARDAGPNFSTAVVNGEPAAFALDLRVNRQPAWSSIGADVRDKLRDSVAAVVTTALVLAGGLAAVWRIASRDAREKRVAEPAAPRTPAALGGEFQG